MRKIILVVFILVFSVGYVSKNTVNAEETKKAKGSITVYLEESRNEAGNTDVALKLVKAGELADGKYVLLDEFKACSIDLNELETADKMQKAAESISREISAKKISGMIKRTDSSGYVRFENLENGIYLLTAEDTNNYDNISPALIAVPAFDGENKEVNGMKYDITVHPKHWPVTAAKTGDNSNYELCMYGGLAVMIFIPLIIKNTKTGG